MAREFSLSAVVEPQVNERQVEREASSTRQSFEDELSDLNIETGDGGIAGAGATPSSEVTGGGGGAVAGAGIGSALSGGGLAKVALGGIVGAGILTATKNIAESSAAFRAEQTRVAQSLELFARPFGRFLATQLTPFTTSLMSMAIKFNKIADDESLTVAIAEVGDDVEFDIPFTDAEISLTEFFDRQSYWEWVDEQGQNVDVSAPFERLYSDIEDAWPGWPDINVEWPGWPDALSNFSWPDLPDFSWPEIPEPDVDFAVDVTVDIAGSVEDFFEDRIDIDSRVDEAVADLGRVDDPVNNNPFDGGGGGGGGSGSDGGLGDTGGGGPGDPSDVNPPGRFDTGGMVGGTGLAVVDRGERVLPPSQVNDRGEADLAGADEITRQLRQIRREIRRQNDDSGDDSAAVVAELRRLRREMTTGGSGGRVSEDDVIAALAKLLDRGGGRNPLER